MISGASLTGKRVMERRNINQENVDALGFVSEEVSLRSYLDMHIHAHAHCKKSPYDDSLIPTT